MLDERSKSLLTKLPKERLDKYVEVRDYLLREFKLTAEQYRERFRIDRDLHSFWQSCQKSFLVLFAKSKS